MRERLLDKAASNGRSITQEIEQRLESTLRAERYLDEALELAYGRQPTALIKMLGRLMVDVGPNAALKSTGTFEGAMNWMSDPFAFDQVVQGVATILEAMRPPGDVTAPDGTTELARMMANGLLIAIKDRECGGELGEWAKPIRAGLGEAVDRMAVDPHAQIMINVIPPQLPRRGQTIESRIIDRAIGRSIGRHVPSEDADDGASS